MSWDSFVIVTDADLGRFEPESVDPSEPWGRATWDDQIEQAKRTLRTWVDADYGHLEGASDRLRDRFAVSHAKAYTAAAFSDVTTAAANDTEEDLDLPAIYATPGSDFLYLGAPWTFRGVFSHLLDSVNAATSALTVAYWAVDQWQTVPSPTDGTAVSGATWAQSGATTWGPIRDWERRSLDGSDEGLYWVRLSINNALTAGTAASHLLAVRRPEGLQMVAAMLAMNYVLRGLALQSPDADLWRTRAEDYLEDAKQLYERLKVQGAIPLDVNVSGAVEPGETGPDSSSVSVIGRMPRA